MKYIALMISFHLLATVNYGQISLTLEDAVKTAIENNFNIRIAQNNAVIQGVNNTRGNAGMLPDVALNFGQTFNINNTKQELANGEIRQGNGAQSRNLNANVQANWTVFDGMRMFVTKDRLEQIENFGKINLQLQIENTISDVMSTYYAIEHQMRRIETIHQAIGISRDRLALAKLKKEGMTALVLDLRRNPGGLLDQAVKGSDLFLKEGVIVSTIGRNKAEKEVISASKNAVYTNFPIIILVNEYSASASEIVSGALQDNNRAIIAGEKTFGKGSVQSVIELNDGSGLKLTVARYFTPKGISIQAEGITPDIEIEEADADHFQKSFIPKQKSTREKDLDGHLKNDREKLMESQKRMGDASSKWWKDFAVKKDDRDSPGDKLRKSDYQIYQALNYLKTWKTFEKTTVN